MLITVKVNRLAAVALDWAVAQCEGLPIKLDPMGFNKDYPNNAEAGFWVWDDKPKGRMLLIGHDYNPSSDWRLCGQIIDRENISISAPSDDSKVWSATGQQKVLFTGSNGMVAAMRTYVANQYGDEIEIPESLIFHLESI